MIFQPHCRVALLHIIHREQQSVHRVPNLNPIPKLISHVTYFASNFFTRSVHMTLSKLNSKYTAYLTVLNNHQYCLL